MRHAARTDAGQKAIIDALHKIGAKVYYLKLPLDLLVCHRGRTFLIECKEPDGRLTKAQVEFIASWPGEVYVVRSPSEAVEMALRGPTIAQEPR